MHVCIHIYIYIYEVLCDSHTLCNVLYMYCNVLYVESALHHEALRHFHQGQMLHEKNQINKKEVTMNRVE